MHKVEGGCHCGNIRVELDLSRAPGTYSPRACDCDFCRKHGASYLSDPDGSARIRVKGAQCLGKYRQGSGIADFLFCKGCGVLVGATYEIGGRMFAAINSRVIEGDTAFGEVKSASPKTLAPAEKVNRWKAIWFPNVALVAEDA